MTSLIIAEIGVNHNGDLELARKLVGITKWAGANAVKFQTFQADLISSPSAPLAEYQKAGLSDKGESSQLEMLKRVQLTENDFTNLKEYCDSIKMEFISTPFDLPSVEFLKPLVNRFKIGSGDLTNYQLLKAVAQTGKPIILSTGMADLQEIKDAVHWIQRWHLTEDHQPGELDLLHCVSSYPAQGEDLNLRAIVALRQTLKLRVGFSDHSIGNQAAVAAISLGAHILEKHLTFSKSLPGPDHQSSANPEEFKHYVESVRMTEKMLGNGVKRCMKSEQENRRVCRRSIAANRDLMAGHVLKESDLISLRPGDQGVPAHLFQHLIGRTLKSSLMRGQFIAEEMLSE